MQNRLTPGLQNEFMPHEIKLDPAKSYLDSAKQQPSSALDTGFKNVLRGALTSADLASNIMSATQGRTEDKGLSELLETLEPLNRERTWTHATTDFVSNLFGQLVSLPPIFKAPAALLGELGGKAAVFGGKSLAGAVKAVGGEALINKAAQKELPTIFKTPLTVGKLGEQSLRLGGDFAGFMAIEDVNEEYDRHTNSFNLRNAAISIAGDGAIGASIPSAPYLLGILKKRIGKTAEAAVETAGEVSIPSSAPKHIKASMPSANEEAIIDGLLPKQKQILSNADAALESGKITPKYHKWIYDAILKPHDPTVYERASVILNEEGHPTNTATHMTVHHILTDAEAKNMTKGAHDGVFSEVQNKTSLPEFVATGSVDRARLNPEVADGIDGWIEHIDDKMQMKNRRLELADADIFNGIKDNMQFSQASIYKKIRKMGFEESHVRNLPYTLPEAIENVASREREIDFLNRKSKDLDGNLSNDLKDPEKRLESTGKKKYKDRISQFKKEHKNAKRKIEKKILELQNHSERILTPKEELQHIRSDLLSDKGVRKNFKNRRSYHRLSELSHYWPQARRLLDRVNLEDAHDQQLSYRNLFEIYSQMIRAPLGRQASISTVMDYMKSKIASDEIKLTDKQEKSILKEMPDAGEIKSEASGEESSGETKEAKGEEGSSDAEKAIENGRKEVDAIADVEARKSFIDSERRFKQFKKSGKILDNLVACALGVMNGKV